VTSKPTVLVPALMTPAEVDLRELVTADSLLLALDFDGVLAPLQDDPETSRMVPASAAAIAELARLPHTRVALVSGRDIATLQRLTQVPEAVWMIGSHGAEADLGTETDPGAGSELGAGAHLDAEADVGAGSALTRSPELTPQEKEMLAAIDAHIAAFEHALPEAGGFSDVLVERKPYSRTVHTRGVAPEVAAALHEHATEVAEEFPAIRVIEGHDITELAVKQATKGDGIRLLARAGAPSAMGYLGDDVTDEDAFAALGELTAPSSSPAGAGEAQADSAQPALDAGLTLKVGTAATAATWRIADPAAVAELLGRLARERAEHLGAGRH
jgi:trehalose 6-phosphate phosphatase